MSTGSTKPVRPLLIETKDIVDLKPWFFCYDLIPSRAHQYRDLCKGFPKYIVN